MTERAGPLFQLDGARVGFSDGTRSAVLDGQADGTRIALLGAWGWFFALLTHKLDLATGQVSIAGAPVSSAVASGVVGVAPLDPRLPSGWTLRRYLEESAALLRGKNVAARTAVESVVGRFDLGPFLSRRLGSLSAPERRSFVLAHASLGDPAVVCCEAPLSRLDGTEQDGVLEALERTTTGRASIVSVSGLRGPGHERALVERSDAVMVSAHGEIVLAGGPELVLRETRRVVATVTRRGTEFRAALEASGLPARRLGGVDALDSVLMASPETQIERFLIDLPAPGETRGVLSAARSAEAPLVELAPIQSGQ